MEEIFEFIKKCGTYYLATVENGKPKNRPFGTVNIFEGKLYIQTGKSKPVSKQIQENPFVEICCFDGAKWLRLGGKLVRDERTAAKKDMLDHYPELRSMYDENDNNTEVLYFESGSVTAVLASFTEPPKTINF